MAQFSRCDTPTMCIHIISHLGLLDSSFISTDLLADVAGVSWGEVEFLTQLSERTPVSRSTCVPPNKKPKVEPTPHAKFDVCKESVHPA